MRKSRTTKLVERADHSGTSRYGTAFANRGELEAVLGKPNKVDEEKITHRWLFATPAGIATLYDYKRSHNFGQYSVGGEDKECVEHLVAHLAKLGINAQVDGY